MFARGLGQAMISLTYALWCIATPLFPSVVFGKERASGPSRAEQVLHCLIIQVQHSRKRVN